MKLTNPVSSLTFLNMVTPAQCRAARGLIDWSQQQLAEAAGVGIVTVRQFEAGKGQPRRATLAVIEKALEKAGVEFTNGVQPGVRLSRRGRRSR
jgi:transcriptional regulator with XRE-family HTH domain